MTAKTATAELTRRPTSPPRFTERDLPPHRTREIDGVAWRYSVAGEGSRGLLVLPGAAGGADVSLRLLPFLDDYRIVTLAYPVVEDLDALMRGIDEILTAEGLARVDVFGGSFGGMAAQCFARHAPERVRRLVLQATGVPTPSRARVNQRVLKVSRWIPMSVWQLLLKLAVRVSLKKMPRDERRFWTGYFDREIGSLSRAEWATRYRLAIDFDRNRHFLPGDLDAVSIPVLVLEGGEDRLAKGEPLRALYPGARVHTFNGAGHGMSFLRPEEWGRVIRKFLTAR